MVRFSGTPESMSSSKSKSTISTQGRTEHDGHSIQVLSRAADILRVIGTESDPLSLGKIALRVGLPRSTVQRIVNALLEEKLLATRPNTNGYQIGPEIQKLAEIGRQDVAKSLHPILETLSHVTGETVDLSICRNLQMIFIDQVVGKQRLRAVSAIGESFPMSVTANGKAVLALKSENYIQKLIDHDRQSGILNKSQAVISKEIKQARQRGYGLDEGEHTPGIAAVGIAFKSAGSCYALSIPTPSSRFASNKQFFIDTLLHTRSEISNALTEVVFELSEQY